MPPSESAAERILKTSMQGPLGKILHVKTGPQGVPHTVTNVERRDGHVAFRGPTLPGQSYEYEAPLDPAIEDIDAATEAAIKKALEERMYQ